MIDMTLLLAVTATGTPEVARPAPERLIAGDPVHRTWLTEEADGLYAGVWESTPGTWRVVYDEWEYFKADRRPVGPDPRGRRAGHPAGR